MSALHQNSGVIAKSIPPLRDFPRPLGIDFPIPPSCWKSTDTIPLPQILLIFFRLVPDRNRHRLILIQHLPSLPLNFLGFIGLFVPNRFVIKTTIDQRLRWKSIVTMMHRTKSHFLSTARLTCQLTVTNGPHFISNSNNQKNQVCSPVRETTENKKLGITKL